MRADLLARAGWFVAGGRTDRARRSPASAASRAACDSAARHRDHVRRRPAPRGDARGARRARGAGARATFFLVGEQVARYPSVAAEIAAAGHEIAIHGYRHVLLLRRAPCALREDFVARARRDRYRDRDANRRSTVRPTACSAGRRSRSRASSAGGHCSGLAGAATGSAQSDAEKIAARASRSLTGGDVVLLHDADHYSSVGSWRRTVAALPSILDAVSASGESLVSASQST